METVTTFASWNEAIHQMPDQQKRLASAKSAKTTPSSVDHDLQEAVFPSSGSKPYHTTLQTCTCVDFIRRKVPCKHIYRLAIELGILEETAAKGINKNTISKSQISLEAAVSELEKLSDDEQLVIKDFLYEHLFHKVDEFPVVLNDQRQGLLNLSIIETVDSPVVAIQAYKRNEVIRILDAHGIVGFKRNMSLKALAAWCVENISCVAELFASAHVFRFSSTFQTAQRKTYTYLLRKFDDDTYMDVDKDGTMIERRYPHGASFVTTVTISAEGTSKTELHCQFPDDNVTRLLTIHGHNRCLNVDDEK